MSLSVVNSIKSTVYPKAILDAVCSSEDPVRRDENASTDVPPAPTAVWLKWYLSKADSMTTLQSAHSLQSAVRTRFREFMLFCRCIFVHDRPVLTCQGQLWGLASSPATTRLSTGGTVGRPQPQAGTTLIMCILISLCVLDTQSFHLPSFWLIAGKTEQSNDAPMTYSNKMWLLFVFTEMALCV